MLEVSGGWLPGELVERLPAEASDWGYPSLPPGSLRPIAVVQHVTQGHDGYLQQIARDGRPSVSAHFVGDRDGTVTQTVSVREAAHHAGRLDASAPSWAWWQAGGRPRNPNKYTLGYELVGFSGEPFSAAQIASLVRVLGWVWAHQAELWDGERPLGAAPELGRSYIAHGEIAVSSRAHDPGPSFPWGEVVAGIAAAAAAPATSGDLEARIAAALERIAAALEGRGRAA